MKMHFKNGYAFFYDTHNRQWTLWPVDSEGKRIEWDKNDNPIEARYFNNKTELNKYLNK